MLKMRKIKTVLIIFLMLFCATAGYGKKVKYTPVSIADDLKNFVGKKVVVDGMISEIPWQHLMNPPSTHPVKIYFDVGKFQIVIYTKKKISCGKTLKVFGTVIQLQGAGKGSKVDETYTEYHVVVDSWKCLK